MLDYKKDESRWTETTYVPPADLTRYITALAFTMYNGDGQKIFTCLNRRHSYTNDFDDQYKDMKDDFADDLKDIKKNKEVLKHSKKIPPPLKYASVISCCQPMSITMNTNSNHVGTFSRHIC